VSRMNQVLSAAASQFRTAGANMGQALADGLNSKVGAVEAAAARLANAAAAATRAAAAIRSPSRVFTSLGDYMGEGLAIGLEGSESRIIASARSIIDGVAAETRKGLPSLDLREIIPDGTAADLTSSGSVSVTAALTPDANADVVAEIRAVLDELRAQRGLRGGDGATVDIDINVAAGMDEVGDEIHREMATLSALGTWSRD